MDSSNLQAQANQKDQETKSNMAEADRIAKSISDLEMKKAAIDKLIETEKAKKTNSETAANKLSAEAEKLRNLADKAKRQEQIDAALRASEAMDNSN